MWLSSTPLDLDACGQVFGMWPVLKKAQYDGVLDTDEAGMAMGAFIRATFRRRHSIISEKQEK